MNTPLLLLMTPNRNLSLCFFRNGLASRIHDPSPAVATVLAFDLPKEKPSIMEDPLTGTLCLSLSS